jgi:CHAD domain-containing protein
MTLTATDLLQQTLLSELGRIRPWRKVALEGKDPEGVHQLRVSLRKMRSALKLFAPVLQPDYGRRWRKRLRKLTLKLDKVRDLDVLLLTHFTSDNTDSPAYQHLAQQQQALYKTLTRELRSKKFKRLRRELKKQLTRKHWQTIYCTDTELPAASLANSELAKLYHDITRQIGVIDMNNDTALHQLRIAFKQLRYGCEFFEPVFESDLDKPFISHIKALQDDLGGIQDAHVHAALFETLPTSLQPELSQLQSRSLQQSRQLKQSLTQDLASFKALTPPWQVISQAAESG